MESSFNIPLRKHNRYTKDIELEYVGDKRYRLKIADANYLRFLVNPDNNHIKSIDPEGGPFMSVGYNIPGTEFKITTIESIKGDGNYITIE